MPKISELPSLSTITNTATWPVLENSVVQKISFANFKSAINTPATANAIGAVKIGNGLAVAQDGTLSVSIPRASAATVGGVKIATGSNLTVNSSGVLSLDSDIQFANGSRITATDTDVLEITSGLVDIRSAFGGINLFAGDNNFNTSIILSSSEIQMNGVVTGSFSGNLSGGVDGYLVGNIYEPGYTGSQNPIFNSTLKTLDMTEGVFGHIQIARSPASQSASLGAYPNYISNLVADEDLIITASGTGKVRIDGLKTGAITSDSGAITINAEFVGITTGENNLFAINSPAGVSITGDVGINGILTSEVIIPNDKNLTVDGGDIRSNFAPLTLNALSGNFYLNVGDSGTYIWAEDGSVSGGTDRLWLNKQVSCNDRFRLPWFTTTQRNAIDTPEQGETIFNTTTSKFQGYTGSVWVDLH